MLYQHYSDKKIRLSRSLPPSVRLDNSHDDAPAWPSPAFILLIKEPFFTCTYPKTPSDFSFTNNSFLPVLRYVLPRISSLFTSIAFHGVRMFLRSLLISLRREGGWCGRWHLRNDARLHAVTMGTAGRTRRLRG